MTGAPVQLLLDVDTGVDDALALVFAALHPALNLRAVTCVAGNAALDQVYRNTRAVLAAAGAGTVPIAKGASRPLLAPWRDASHVHGGNGLANLVLDAPDSSEIALHAVELMRQEILASPTPPTLVALAPLTNIALLVRMYPDVVGRLERIVFMGGAVAGGNATPVAEFNIWGDPEAAAIVLDAGVPITMYGLEVFYAVAVGRSQIEGLEQSPSGPARLCAALLRHLAGNNGQTRFPPGKAATIGDAGAVCMVADPEGIVTRSLPVSICVDGSRSRGQTIVDLRSRPGESELHGASLAQPIDVAFKVSGERYARLFCETVGSS